MASSILLNVKVNNNELKRLKKEIDGLTKKSHSVKIKVDASTKQITNLKTAIKSVAKTHTAKIKVDASTAKVTQLKNAIGKVAKAHTATIYVKVKDTELVALEERIANLKIGVNANVMQGGGNGNNGGGGVSVSNSGGSGGKSSSKSSIRAEANARTAAENALIASQSASQDYYNNAAGIKFKSTPVERLARSRDIEAAFSTIPQGMDYSDYKASLAHQEQIRAEATARTAQQNASKTNAQRTQNYFDELYGISATESRIASHDARQADLNKAFKAKSLSNENIKAQDAEARASKKSLDNTAQSVDKVQKKSSSMLGTFLKWSAISTAVSGVTSAFSDAYSMMKEVDTELVTVRKVTGMSADEADKLADSVYNMGAKYGRTADELLVFTTTFARAGYGKEDLTNMTEMGALLQNIGDISAEDASKFMIAADAAWDMKHNSEELMAVIDGMNEVTNNAAVDMQALTEGITVSGSIFAQSGESAQTFTAMLGTAVAATQRSGSEVGRGLRTILMNVRNITGELDDGTIIDEDSIGKAGKALKEVGVDVEDANGDLRKASDILEDLAGKWDTLTDAQQSKLGQALAGKTRSNILYALMGNWEEYERQMQLYADGAGSAMEENEIYLDSWEAKANQLKSTWTNLVQTLTDTDLIKGSVDVVTEGLENFQTNVEFLSEGLDLLQTNGHKNADWLAQFSELLSETSVGKMTEGLAKLFGKDFSFDEIEENIKEPANLMNVIDALNQSDVGKDNGLVNLIGKLGAFDEEGNINIETLKENLEGIEGISAKSIEDIWSALEKFGLLDGADWTGYDPSDLEEGTSEYEAYQQHLQDVADKFAEERRETLHAELEQEKREREAAEAQRRGRWEQQAREDGIVESPISKLIPDSVKPEIKASLQIDADMTKAKEEINAEIAEITSYNPRMTVNADGTPATATASWISSQIAAMNPKMSIGAKDDTGTTVSLIKQKIEQIKANITVGASSGGGGSRTGVATGTPYASGTDFARGGISLVNENGAELIQSNGRAYIAGQGKPTLTYLERGAKVWTATETRNILASAGVQSFASGSYSPYYKNAPTTTYDLYEKLPYSHYISKSPYDDDYTDAQQKQIDKLQKIISLKKSSVELSKAEDMKIKTQISRTENVRDALKKEIDYLVKIGGSQEEINRLTTEWYNLNDDIKALQQSLWQGLSASINKELEESQKKTQERVDHYNDLIDAAKEEREEKEKAKELEEKTLAVEEARKALKEAQNNRTVRYFNAATGQWEWGANKSEVDAAKQELEDAKQELKDYKEEQKFNQKIANLEAKRDDAQRKGDEYEDKWNRVLTALEESVPTIKQSLNKIANQADKTMLPQIRAINKILEEEFGISINESKLYDSGGVLNGLGGIKATVDDEMILPPSLTKSMLAPSANTVFRQRIAELGALYGSNYGNYKSIGSTIATQNNGDNYNFGNITLTTEQAKSTTVYQLARMSRNLSMYNKSR